MASKDLTAALREVSLTTLERKTIMNVLSVPGCSFASACRAAGYSLKPGQSAHLIKKRIEGKLGPVMERIGITEFELGSVIGDALGANRTIPSNIRKYDKDGKVCGEKIELTVVPDYALRLRAVELLLKCGPGYLAPKKVDLTGKLKLGLDQGDTLDKLDARELPADFEVTSVN